MGYTNVYWYKEGLKGWRAGGNFVEMEDFSYMTRKLPPPVSPAALKAELDKNNDAVVLVDIRGKKSRDNSGTIAATSTHMPIYRFDEEYSKLPLDKKLVMYDIRGKQASSAVRFLLDQNYDFSRITWLEGGISSWIENGYPVERP